jgi:hypothetical protein
VSSVVLDKAAIDKEINFRGEQFARFIKRLVIKVYEYTKIPEYSDIRSASALLSFDEVKAEIKSNLFFDNSNNGNREYLKRIINYDGPMPNEVVEILDEDRPLPCIFSFVRYTTRVDIAKLLFLYGAACENIEYVGLFGRMDLYQAAEHSKEMQDLIIRVQVICEGDGNLLADRNLFPNDEEVAKYTISWS